jgi:hypothetical protein
MTLKEFVNTHQRHDYKRSPLSQTQRYGQWLFNELYDVKPELANSIRGTMVDPFYHDNRTPEFWCALILKWE